MLMVLIWEHTLRITEVDKAEVDGHQSLLESSIIYWSYKSIINQDLLVVFPKIILIQEDESYLNTK